MKGRRDHSIFKDLVIDVLNDLEKKAANEEGKKQAKKEMEEQKETNIIKEITKT